MPTVSKKMIVKKKFFEHFLHPTGSYLVEAPRTFGYNDVN